MLKFLAFKSQPIPINWANAFGPTAVAGISGHEADTVCFHSSGPKGVIPQYGLAHIFKICPELVELLVFAEQFTEITTSLHK